MAICMPQVSKNISDFDVRSVPGCVLWLDAADTSSLTLSGSNITAWRDKSTFGNNVNQISSTPPTYNSADSSVNFLATSATFLRGTLSTSYTNASVFIVASIITHPSSPGFPRLSILSSSASANSALIGQLLLVNVNNPSIATYLSTNGNPTGQGTNFMTFLSNATFSTRHLISNTTTYSGTNYTISTLFNGNTQTYSSNTGTFSTNSSNVGTYNKYTLGNYPDAAGIGDAFNGKIFEYIIFNDELTIVDRQRVEGYLAHKWRLANTLFTPLSIPGCTMWLDGADPAGTGTPPSAGTLATWVDKSGSGRNAVQHLSLALPQFVPNSLNLKGGVSFTAASTQCYKTASVLPVPRTLFIVGFTSDGGFCLSGIPTPNSGHPPYYVSFARDVEFGVNNTSDTAHSANVATSLNTNYILTGLYTGSTVSVIINGGTLSTSLAFSGTPKTPVTTLIGVNSYAGTLNAYLSGTINEFITYSVDLDNDQRQEVERYLANKWGLTLLTTFPIVHPFYYNKPQSRRFEPIDISGCELWFDGADYTTMFQNTAGTTPVTAGSQSVACWKDKVRNLSVTDTGISGRASVAPTSLSGGGLFFSNVDPAPTSNTRSLGAYLTGVTNQTSFLFQMPTKSMTMFIVSLPASNNGYRRICLMGSWPLSGGPPNFLIGPQMGVSEGGTIVVDLNAGMSAWAQELNTTTGYNSSAVLRVDTLTIGTTGSWFTNGTANTPSTNTTYTSTNTNYPVNFLYLAGYSSTIDGGRSFNGNIYEILLYSKALTTSERQQVEGYLAHKWGFRTSLPTTTPFYNFPSSVPLPFLPANIDGLSVWFDAADTSTINGLSTVTAWRDKSTNKWNATTLIGTAPTNTTVNGNNAVSFAASSVLTVSNVTFSNVQSRAIFIVYRVPTSAPNYISFFSTQGGGLNNQGGHNNLIYPSGGGGPYLQSYAVGGAVQGMGADPAVSTIGTTAIACMIHSAISTSNNVVTLNGTSYALSTNTLASGYGSGTVTYYIGNGYPQAYILCEYIMYQREVTTLERQQIEGYLAHKWGTTSSLPVTHPYKKIQPSQVTNLLITPGTISSVTLSSLSGTGGTITWGSSTNAIGYYWYVGTGSGSGQVATGRITSGSTLTTSVSYAFVASTNYFAWVIPYSSTGTNGATTISSSASYSSGGGGDITSANLNTIATYLRSYMSEFRNPSFYGYNLDGTSYSISDGGGDMYDGGNWTYPWLISGTNYTGNTGSVQVSSINYASTTATTVDTDFIYASLGYATSSGGSITSNHPLTVLGFRSTVGRPVGFQLGGNSGADGGGTLASGILYAGTTLSGFTVHAFYRETYNAGDPSHCNLFILLGHTNWSSVFGTINSFADPVSNGGNGAYFYTSGAGVKNILAVQTLLSKSGGVLVTSAECQTVVQAFANRIKLALGF